MRCCEDPLRSALDHCPSARHWRQLRKALTHCSPSNTLKYKMQMQMHITNHTPILFQSHALHAATVASANRMLSVAPAKPRVVGIVAKYACIPAAHTRLLHDHAHSGGSCQPYQRGRACLVNMPMEEKDALMTPTPLLLK
jgi:hypothetical protein